MALLRNSKLLREETTRLLAIKIIEKGLEIKLKPEDCYSEEIENYGQLLAWDSNPDFCRDLGLIAMQNAESIIEGFIEKELDHVLSDNEIREIEKTRDVSKYLKDE